MLPTPGAVVVGVGVGAVLSTGGGGISSGAFFWQAASASADVMIIAVAKRVFIMLSPFKQRWNSF